MRACLVSNPITILMLILLAIGTTTKNTTQTTNFLKMTRTGSVISRSSRKWRTTWRMRLSVLLKMLLCPFQRGTS